MLFRRLSILTVLAGTLSLASCSGGPGGGGGGLPSIDPATVQQIQNTANQVCGFLPTVETVASIIATFTGGGAIVDMVSHAATGICAAVSKKGLRRGGPAPVYRGVKIKGAYTR